MPRPEWPAERIAAILELAGQGVQGVEIARRLNIPIRNLRSWASRRGLRFRKPAADETRRNKRLHLTAWNQGLRLEASRSEPGKYMLFEPMLSDPVSLDEIESMLARPKRAGHRNVHRVLTPAQKAAISSRTDTDRASVTLPAVRFTDGAQVGD
jgi:hypothetical protein